MYRANRGYPGTGGRFFPSAADLDSLSPNPEGSLLNPDSNPGFAPKKKFEVEILLFYFVRKEIKQQIFYLTNIKDSQAPREASSPPTRISSS